MSLQRRIAALEKKRLAACAADDRILGIIDYCDSQGFPEWDGVHRKGQQVIGVIGGIRIPPEDWPEACRAQQKRLMDELGHVDKWRIQRRIDVMSMKPRKLSAVLS